MNGASGVGTWVKSGQMVQLNMCFFRISIVSRVACTVSGPPVRIPPTVSTKNGIEAM